MDVYSAHSKPTTFPVNSGTATISTDITIEPPSGTYEHILSRSSLAFKHNIHIIGGVIDSDYCGTINIRLIGQSDIPYRIAQVILENSYVTLVSIVNYLTPTARDKQGFESTEKIKH